MVNDMLFSLYKVMVETDFWPIVVRTIIGLVICLVFAGIIALIWYYAGDSDSDSL